MISSAATPPAYTSGGRFASHLFGFRMRPELPIAIRTAATPFRMIFRGEGTVDRQALPAHVRAAHSRRLPVELPVRIE
jgi:hypothetical protein